MTNQERAELENEKAARGRKLTEDLIAAFKEIRDNDPETFYRSMGYDGNGIDIMDPFYNGSYELGLIAGARYALENLTHLLKEENA